VHNWHLTDVTGHARDVRSWGKADIAAVSGRGLGFIPKQHDRRRRRRRVRSTDPGLQDSRCHFSARARQRVHGQPDRGDRRDLVAGDGRPRPAAPAALTPRAIIDSPDLKWGPGVNPHGLGSEPTSFYFYPPLGHARPVFLGDPFLLAVVPAIRFFRFAFLLFGIFFVSLIAEGPASASGSRPAPVAVACRGGLVAAPSE
jgi:hypothetical protein